MSRALLLDFDGLVLDTETTDFESWAEDAIAVEDSPNGVAAAKAAELFCVAVPGPMTRSLSFEHADLVLDSLASRSLSAVLHERSAVDDLASSELGATGRGPFD